MAPVRACLHALLALVVLSVCDAFVALPPRRGGCKTAARGRLSAPSPAPTAALRVHAPLGEECKEPAAPVAAESGCKSVAAAADADDQDLVLDQTLQTWMAAQGIRDARAASERAQLMVRLGYTWDKERRAWGRTENKLDPVTFKRVRSSLRSVVIGDLVAANVMPASVAMSEKSKLVPDTAQKALNHLGEVLQNARLEALSTRAGPTTNVWDEVIKMVLSAPRFPLAWLSWECATAYWLYLYAAGGMLGDGSAVAAMSSTSPLLGALAVFTAIPLGFLSAKSLGNARGLDYGAGRFERMMVDAALGSHALPAVWEWRRNSAAWCGWQMIAKAVRGVRMTMLWQGCLHQSLRVIPTMVMAYAEPTPGLLQPEAQLLAPLMTVIATAAVAAILSLPLQQHPSYTDGIEAELYALELAEIEATSHFRFDRDTKGNLREATAAAAAFRTMSKAYRAKFEKTLEQLGEEPALAFLRMILLGASYELSGSNLCVPIWAQITASVVEFILLPDPQRDIVHVDLEELEREMNLARTRFDAGEE